MHIVTKILMVACAVLALLLAALTMAFASNAGAIRQSIKTEMNRRAAAENELSALSAKAGVELTTQEDRRKAAESARDNANKRIAELEQENTNLRSREQQALADAASIRNQISQLGASADTLSQLVTNYRNEVTSLRDSNMGFQKREIELLDRINDLESAREVLEQNARALKEQLEETKLALQTAQQGAQSGAVLGAAAQGVKSSAREMAGPLVRARVTQTFRSPAGDEMVVINEGSNRGIKPNTLMNIVRGSDQFVASIEIVSVEPTSSVGKVKFYARQYTSVMSDDVVLSRLDY